MTKQRLITGVSGASAPQLAWAVLGALRASQAVETHPVLSTGAEKTIEAEMGLALGPPAGRVHLVVEVTDIDQARQLRTAAPAPEAVSWGARLFQVRDPDGVPVTFIQWDDRGRQGP